jgi:hypothetical protein
MTAETVRVVVEPGPGCCGTISLGASTVLAYRFGAGPPAVADVAVAVTLTNQAGPVAGGAGGELWVPATWTAGGAEDTDVPAARRLPGEAPGFTSDVLGGAQVLVLSPEPEPLPGMPAAARPQPGTFADAGDEPPFDDSWIRQQRELRALVDKDGATRPKPKVGGHGNVVTAIRSQAERGRAVAEWRAESTTALVVLLRTPGVCVLVGSGLDADTWLSLRAQHREALRDVDVAVVRVSPEPLRHLPSYLRSALPRASAVVDSGHPGRQWPVGDPTRLEVTTREEAGRWIVEARTR